MSRKNSWHYAGTMLMMPSQQTNTCSKNESRELKWSLQLWKINHLWMGALHRHHRTYSEAVARRCSVKRVFLEIPQILQENTYARTSYLIKLQALKKRPFHRCFLVNFAKFLRMPFLTEHLQWLLLSIENSQFSKLLSLIVTKLFIFEWVLTISRLFHLLSSTSITIVITVLFNIFCLLILWKQMLFLSRAMHRLFSYLPLGFTFARKN